MSVLWRGTGVDEVGSINGVDIVKVDPRYFRPTEVENLLGDASKAKEQLGWIPSSSFEELVSEMAREDLKEVERIILMNKHGYTANKRIE